MTCCDKTSLAGIAAYLLVMCTWYGCEVHHEDGELRGYAVEANEYVGQHFGAKLTDSDLTRYGLYWGERSECQWIDHHVIFIRRDLRGNPNAIRAHMRHEVFHCVSRLFDGQANTFNGVRIAEFVAWED